MSEKPLDLELWKIGKEIEKEIDRRIDFWKKILEECGYEPDGFDEKTTFHQDGYASDQTLYMIEKRIIPLIKQHIKSAVQGLLAELKLECKPYDFIEVGNKKLSFEQIKQIIEKWFPNIIEEGEDYD